MAIGGEPFSDKLIGWIGSVVVAVIVWLIQRVLTPGAKIRFWIPHDFVFLVPPPQPPQLPQQQALPREAQPQPPAAIPRDQPAPAAIAQAPAIVGQGITIRTSTLTVQNLGRKVAENVEIIHQQKPDHFQLFPQRNYSETTAPDGTHVVMIETLARREVIQMQVLSYARAPSLVTVRSKDGPGRNVPFQIYPQLPRSVLYAIQVIMLIGAMMTLYWFVRAALFLSRANGML
ncbi:hypothetical protein C0Z18_18480 [Trinickia dabaoshanensis]|uniref:Uncharacterized protein n=1 Tax=Trinickia dabaoshanensis TaxID=564714 RepID=A0A2N7VL04_9BURK|nr:hypothetical protein [Trinickia dabaoshanensis]PMS17834.1 hypothetical protein C0Z18_18480 [Trinickia dabaoshanensis]